MENVFRVRTDMASEAHRIWRQGATSLDRLPGVEAEESQRDGFSLFRVRILDEEGAQALGKPVGQYFTLELDRFFSRGDEGFERAVQALAGLLRDAFVDVNGPSLVVGLGNSEITPDALGPTAAQYVFPTRHLKLAAHPLFQDFSEVAVCSPGVMGTTGMESALQIAAFCREIKPARVVVVDALAGSDPGRLCRTIQIADSGIAPGSGVGNDRSCLSRETLGVPVVAVGVPTVIDASAFGDDSGLRGLFVTPKDIDATIRAGARLIGYAVDLALHPGLEVDDVTALID